MSARRAPGPVVTVLPSVDFRPRHCAGETCLHNHVVETRPRMRLFPQAPVPAAPVVIVWAA